MLRMVTTLLALEVERTRAPERAGEAAVGSFVNAPSAVASAKAADQLPAGVGIERWDGSVQPELVRPGTVAWDRRHFHFAAYPARLAAFLGITKQREVLYKPEVDNDSLRGAGSPEARTLDRAVGLEDVRSVATLHLSPGKTIGLSVGVGAVVGIIIALATWQGPLGGCCGQ